MAINDPLGDLLTRIRNGQKAGMQSIASPASKLRANVLDVLKREGYIRDFSLDQSKPGGEANQVANLLPADRAHGPGERLLRANHRIAALCRARGGEFRAARRDSGAVGIEQRLGPHCSDHASGNQQIE